MKSKLIIFAFLLPAISVFAQICTSADYAIAAETFDSGGATVASAGYVCNDSVSAIGSTAGEPVTGYLVKSGYPGQLYDVTNLTPTALASAVNEGMTLQLGAIQLLDDATCLVVNPGTVGWNIVAGPINSINSGGLAWAGTVYQDTPATVQASLGGFSGTLQLTVINVGTDDFGIYAGDGLPDDWQVQYFGPNNPNAAPNIDADGTGQTNLFKYIAGLDPTDPTSRFAVRIQPVPAQPGQMQIIFAPVVSGRTYAVVNKIRLSDSSWAALTGTAQTDNVRIRTVTDLNATSSSKYYRVQISMP